MTTLIGSRANNCQSFMRQLAQGVRSTWVGSGECNGSHLSRRRSTADDQRACPRFGLGRAWPSRRPQTAWESLRTTDTTLVSAIRQDSTPRLGATVRDEVAWRETRCRKKRVCPELTGVVAHVLSTLAAAKARSVPQVLQGLVRMAWRRRCEHSELCCRAPNKP